MTFLCPSRLSAWEKDHESQHPENRVCVNQDFQQAAISKA